MDWCRKRDSNSHAIKHWLLRPACLPFHHTRKILNWYPEPDSNRHALQREILNLLCLPFHHRGIYIGGSSEIRTHGPCSGPSVFKTDVLYHASIGPLDEIRTRNTLSRLLVLSEATLPDLSTRGNWRRTSESNRNRSKTDPTAFQAVPITIRVHSPFGTQDESRTRKSSASKADRCAVFH